MHSLLLCLLSTLWSWAIAPESPLPHVEQYEVVWPRRLAEPRARRALTPYQGPYPESVSYVLGARGHTFTLHLQKNKELLGSGYKETYSAANGSEVTEQLHGQDHCLYQGHVEGHQGSAASLSTCAGLRGFFQVDSTVHLIEPLDEGGEEGRHAVYQAKHLQQKAGTCGVSNTSLHNLLGVEPRVSPLFRSQPRNWPIRGMRYVELYVVTDSTEFQLLGSREAVRSRVLEVVNHVDKLYQELNFRVVLVGLEIWDRDKFFISRYANVTLENFLSWRARDLLGRLPHDNVQLITGVDFLGTTVGLAKVSAVCSQHSGAVNQDHNKNPIGVASTMAHELGHNLGMNHDENIQGCYCPVSRERGGCIMTESFGSKFPRIFSRCSQSDLQIFMEKPQTGCLANAPDVNRLVGGPVCGNLFVERGEQCDCGAPQDCQNPCCNATTCQLAKGAECAHGDCCHECKVKPAGEPCRPQKDKCDLEEFCDGQKPACPEDAFQQNGTPCPGGYCFNGNCPTMAQQCQELWGPGVWVAADACFSYTIPPGCNGRILSGKTNRCGVLYCAGGQKPPERGSCTFSSHMGVCHALLTDSNTDIYEPVLQGTKCEEGKVCWEGRCQDLHIYGSKNCSAKCHNHGVCNHKRQCHCQAGWAPPHCAELLVDVHAVATEHVAVRSTTASGDWLGRNGGGGSVCLEPCTTPSILLPESQESWSSRNLPVSVLVALVILVVVIIILASFFIYRKAWSQVHRRTVVPKPTPGLSNPLFFVKGSDMPAKSKIPGPPELVCTSQPPRPTVTPKRSAPVPPVAMFSPPLPVPVYTQEGQDQLRPVPPTKPLPKLKPKQVKPTFAPPEPPSQPRAGKTMPGVTQEGDTSGGPKVALKPPVQRR